MKNLRWRNIGPAIMGGRIDDFAVVENNPSTIYVGTASGGLFKSINNGTTWESIFDKQNTLSIGDVTVAPSDPNIVWVGTGEANNRQSSTWGNGVYKSTDAGKTWTNMGLPESRHIGRIVIDPRNPNVVLVAAGGDLWGASKERGVYRTEDGGKTWSQALFVNEDTGCTDISIDLSNPNILYAAMYQRRRTAFGFNGGGAGSGIYKSVDNGKTWKRLETGLPKGDLGRIGLDIYRKNSNVVYCSLEHATEGGIYRSDDKGETWKKMGTVSQATSGFRPMYFSQIRIDPNDDQKLFLAGVSMGFSVDGGKSFKTSGRADIHADVHAIWIDPTNSNHMMVGCDGGIQWTYDGAKTWDFVNNLVVSQFYEVAFDFQKPYWVYGGLQDNGSWGAPSATLNGRGVSNDEWINVGGGDGFYCAADPTDPSMVYSESQNGAVGRLNRATGERKSIRPRPEPGETPYRFDWNAPILISPHNHKRIYVAAERLFISDDRGDTWRRTEDLSGKPDRTKFTIMGALPEEKKTLSLNDGQDTFGQIVTISESPMNAGILYVGTDDGQLQVSLDDGKTWKNIVANVSVPKGTYVTRVLASSHVIGRVYASFDGHRSDDFKPYLFVSEDFGETWKPISANLEMHYTIKAIREHPTNPALLFAGTERGLFVSMNRGASWSMFSTPLPPVTINDIQIHPRENDLILATHGRGIWILDDITPLSEMAGLDNTDPVKLFKPHPAVQFRNSDTKANTGSRFYLAGAPPSGALIQYYLKEKQKDETPVKITIWDRENRKALSEVARVPAEAGVNRVSWDMRFSPPAKDPSDDEPLLRELTPTEIAEQEETGEEGRGESREEEARGGKERDTTFLLNGGYLQNLSRTSDYAPLFSIKKSIIQNALRTILSQKTFSAYCQGQTGRRTGTGLLRGPRLLPGVYQVHLLVGKEEYVQPIEVADDPRTQITPQQRKQRYELEVKLLNAASSLIGARSQLNTLKIELGNRMKAEGFDKIPRELQGEATRTLAKTTQLLLDLNAGKRVPPTVPETPKKEVLKPVEDAPSKAPATGVKPDEPAQKAGDPPKTPAPRVQLFAPGYSRISSTLFNIDSITEPLSKRQVKNVDIILRDLRPLIDSSNAIFRTIDALSAQLKDNKQRTLTETPLVLKP